MSSLGVAITRSTLRGVLVRRERVVWSASVVCHDDDSPIAGIARLLETFAASRMRAPRVVVGIGEDYCRIKPLAGLPRRTTLATLTRIVRENSASFFLRIGARIVVSDVHRVREAEYWGAAFDADLVEGVVLAFRTRGLTRVDVAPMIALRHATASAQASSIPGDGRARWDPELIDAYTAAIAPRPAPFALRPEPDPRRLRSHDRLRVGAGIVLLFLSASAALLAPGLRAIGVAAGLAAESGAAAPAQSEAVRVQAELSRVTAQLDRIGRFASSRGGMTVLLGDVAEALPESVAILTLRVDSAQGSFVVLASHASAVVPALSSIRALTDTRILGSVTRETEGAVRLERATIHFRRTSAAVGRRAQPRAR